MENAAQSFIEILMSQIVEIDAQVGPLLDKRKTKANLANATAADAGLPLPYPDADASPINSAATMQDVVAPDRFTSMKMATACRDIMQRRKTRGMTAISLDDIYTQLKAGGYAFRTVGKESSMNSLATTLGKNMQFRRVPGSAGLWGLTEWYGGPARRKSAASGADDDGDDDGQKAPDVPTDSPAKPGAEAI
jgi:hypothetical protein